MTLLNKVTNSEGVSSSVAGSKSLVCHVKEREKLLLSDDVRNFLPLLESWVNTGGIMGTGMEKDDALCWGILGVPFSVSHVMPFCPIVDHTSKSSFKPAKSRPTVFLSK